jgi:hypothetical protein
MEQTLDSMFRATIRDRALAHPVAPGISGGERRNPRQTTTRTRCKAHAEKRDDFTPSQHHDEVRRKAREVSVYQALEATKDAAEGDDGREKSVKRERQPLIGFE